MPNKTTQNKNYNLNAADNVVMAIPLNYTNFKLVLRPGTNRILGMKLSDSLDSLWLHLSKFCVMDGHRRQVALVSYDVFVRPRATIKNRRIASLKGVANDAVMVACSRFNIDACAARGLVGVASKRVPCYGEVLDV